MQKFMLDKKFLNYLIDKNVDVIYGVEYLPEFDFCEYIFAKIKNEYYKNKYNNKVK